MTFGTSGMETALLLGIVLLISQVTSASGGTDCNDIREDPTSCSHFYKCDHGNPVRFECPDKLYFNPSILVCDYPYNVKCAVDDGQGSSQQAGNNGNYYGNGGQDSGNNGNYNNKGGQYNGNNGNPNNNAGQYNGNPSYNGGQYNTNNGNPSFNGGDNSNNGYPNNNGGNYNDNDDYLYDNEDQFYNNQGGSTGNNQGQDLFYPVQPIHAQDPNVAPSIQEPEGINFEENRPRPTIDQLYNSNGNPYQDYLNPNRGIDIRK